MGKVVVKYKVYVKAPWRCDEFVFDTEKEAKEKADNWIYEGPDTDIYITKVIEEEIYRVE